MGRDKDSLVYHSLSNLVQRKRCFNLLDEVCERTYVSCRNERATELQQEFPVIVDSSLKKGPGAGIFAAHELYPNAAWLVLACDFPYVDDIAIRLLIESREKHLASTFFVHADSTIEPLLTIWEKPALLELQNGFKIGDESPRRALERADKQFGSSRVVMGQERYLVNVNSPHDAEANQLILGD
jgi:molybdopterin-guanine dinucleotide biosynthesis protein A